LPGFSKMPLRFLRPALSVCGLIFLAACGGVSEADKLAALPVSYEWQADDYKYRLGAGDELGLRLLLNPDLNSQVTVGADGRGVFPLVGPVKLSGMTVEEAAATLTKSYAAYLRNPATEMLIYNYAGGSVYIGGEVKLPGGHVIHGNFTVAQAINDAGGFTELAGQNKVVLLRHRKTGEVLMRVINLNKLYSGKDDVDIRVLPGDVIYVPRSSIGEVDRIVHQYIVNALPFTVNYSLNPTTNVIPQP